MLPLPLFFFFPMIDFDQIEIFFNACLITFCYKIDKELQFFSIMIVNPFVANLTFKGLQ